MLCQFSDLPVNYKLKVSGALSDRFSKSREIRAPNPNLFSQTAFPYYLINVYF